MINLQNKSIRLLNIFIRIGWLNKEIHMISIKIFDTEKIKQKRAAKRLNRYYNKQLKQLIKEISFFLNQLQKNQQKLNKLDLRFFNKKISQQGYIQAKQFFRQKNTTTLD